MAERDAMEKYQATGLGEEESLRPSRARNQRARATLLPNAEPPRLSRLAGPRPARA
jgi:hypothetical protein